jgi:hypothetical protein
MRAALRFAEKSEVEAILQELIADAKNRIVALEEIDQTATAQKQGPRVGSG